MMVSFCEEGLQPKAQPRRRYTFRYLSDGSRAPLKAEVGVWPEVKLFYPKSDFIEVVCQLVQWYEDEEVYLTSANCLMPYGKREIFKDTDQSLVSGNGFVRAEMIYNGTDAYTYALSNFCITKTRSTDIPKVFKNLEALLEPGMVPLPSVALAKKKFLKHDKNYLAFTAYKVVDNKRIKIANTIYSNNILNGNKLVINHCSFSCEDGSIYVNLLLSDVRHDYEISLNAINECSETFRIKPKNLNKINLRTFHNLLCYPIPNKLFKNLRERSRNCRLTLYDEGGIKVCEEIITLCQPINAIKKQMGLVRPIQRKIATPSNLDIDSHGVLPIHGFLSRNLKLDFMAAVPNKSPPTVKNQYKFLCICFGEISAFLVEKKKIGTITVEATCSKIEAVNKKYFDWCDRRGTIFHTAVKMNQQEMIVNAFKSIEDDHKILKEVFRHIAKWTDEEGTTFQSLVTEMKGDCHTSNYVWLLDKLTPHSTGGWKILESVLPHEAYKIDHTILYYN